MKVEDFFIDQQKVILRENLENFFANPQKDCSDCFDKYKKLFQKKELHEFLTQIILDEVIFFFLISFYFVLFVIRIKKRE